MCLYLSYMFSFNYRFCPLQFDGHARRASDLLDELLEAYPGADDLLVVCAYYVYNIFLYIHVYIYIYIYVVVCFFVFVFFG